MEVGVGEGDAWGTGWMVVAMLLLAVIIVLTSLLPPVFGVAWGTFWQAAAALATTAAVVMALWLGIREGRWRREAIDSQRFQAALYALSREEWVKDAASKVDAMIRRFSGGKVEECFIAPQDLSREFDEIISLLDKIDKGKIALVDATGARHLVNAIGVLQYLEHYQRRSRESWVLNNQLRSYLQLLENARGSLETLMRVLMVLELKVDQQVQRTKITVDQWS